MLCCRRASYHVLKNKLKLLRNVDIALAWLVFFGFIYYCGLQLIFTNELEPYTSIYFWRDCFVVCVFWMLELALAVCLRLVIDKHDLRAYKLWFWVRIIMEACRIMQFLCVVYCRQRSVHNVHWSMSSNFGLLKITFCVALFPYRIYELLLLKDFRKYICTIEVSPIPADIENPGNPTFSNGDGGDATQVPFPDQNEKIASFLRSLADRVK